MSKRYIYTLVVGMSLLALLVLLTRPERSEKADHPRDPVYTKPVSSAKPLEPEKTNRPPTDADSIQGSLTSAVQDLFRRSAGEYDTLTVEELISAIQAEGTSPEQRHKLIWALCRRQDPQARHFLETLILDPTEDEYSRSIALEGLAVSGQPWAFDLAVNALRSPSATVARGAVRALGYFKTEESVRILSELAFDFVHDPTVAREAADALGKVGTPSAAQALEKLFEQGVTAGSNEAIEYALTGLGRINMEEGLACLADIYSLATDPEIRRLVVESLEDAEGSVAQVIQLARQDSDAEVRAAAAWTLAYADQPGMSSDDIADWLANEPDALVRRNLYLALDNQEVIDENQILPLIRAEQDAAVQLTGYQTLYRVLKYQRLEPNKDLIRILAEGLTELRNDSTLTDVQQHILDSLIHGVDSF